MILCCYNNNMKIVYLNVNCVVGFKFFEMKLLIFEGVFDVFVLVEIKIDEVFFNLQFYIKGYKMFCKDCN